MRKHTIFLFLLMAFCALSAQDECDNISAFSSGQQWVHQWYGTNEKPSFTSYSKVIGAVLENRSEVAVVILNSFQDTVYQGHYFVECTPTGLYQELLGKLTPDMLQSLNGLEIRTGQKGWLLPHSVQAGDAIPQSYSHISGYDNGLKIIDLDLAIGPVIIHDREDLSTPAGGFPCVTMSYELWVTQMTRKRFKLRDWFSPGVGIIRREVFDRKGKFYGYCELVEFQE